MTSDSDPPGRLQDLYQAAYPRLVGAFTVATGRRDEAEEIVQEAFTRLVPNWDQVSQLENPEAWVRKVALRVMIDRRRRAARAVRLWQQRRADDRAADDRDGALDIERAIATLSLPQRQVLLLHHFYDMPVEETARLLNLRAGTVKSRLGRARAKLAVLLDEEVTADA